MSAKFSITDKVYVSDTPYSVQDVRWNGGEWEYTLRGWFASQYFPEHLLLSEDEHQALVARVEASIERNKQHRLMVLERMKQEGK